MKRLIKSIVVAATFAGFVSGACAIEVNTFPAKHVTIVVPFSPGGVTDIVARLVADQLSRQWQQPVVIENRAGAGGNIGAAYVARSGPDGYTLLFAGTSIVINAVMDDAAPYTLKKDLVPVALVADLPHVIVATKSLGVSSLPELVAYSKQHPDQLNFGSGGIGTSSHVAGELLKQVTGMSMTHVPFKGAAGATSELIAGRIQVMSDSAQGLLPHIEQGAITALATPSAKRIPFLPNVPTVSESSPYEMQVSSWLSVWAPGGTPPELIAHINHALAEAVRQPSVRAALEKQLVLPVGSPVSAFSDFVDEEIRKWREVVQKAGVKRE